MKKEDIKQLSTKELLERVEEEKTTLVKLKMNHAISPLENPQKIVETRRLIARLMTEATSRKKNETTNAN